MNRHFLLGTLALALSLCGPTRAADHCNHWSHLLGLAPCVPDCVAKRCCDDYCPKPLPCVRGVCHFCCDDYCPKPLPCVRGVHCFCCDDYCPKPLPCVHCCPPPPGLTCGPAEHPLVPIAVHVCKQPDRRSSTAKAATQRRLR